ARLEQSLQRAAEGNQRVAHPSTAAQYSHALRRQPLHTRPRPLAIMTPKSLLRLHASMSRLEELSSGGFKRLIDDASMEQKRDQVRRMVLCTGRIYYDLTAAEARRSVDDLAI